MMWASASRKACEAAAQQRVDQQQVGDRLDLAVEADAAGDRQDVQVHGEQHQQQDAEPEAGQRDAEQRADGGELVEDRVLPDRGQHAERDRRRQRDDQRDEAQFDGRRQTLGDDVDDRPAVIEAEAEIALYGVAEEDEEALVAPAGRARGRGAAPLPARG